MLEAAHSIMAYTAMQNVVAFSFLVMAAASFPPAGLNATGGQCTTASYEFCCNVGKACMCRLPKGSHGQCMHTSYDFCCDIGRPCDCSKGPHSGKLTCEVIKLACNKVFVKDLTGNTKAINSVGNKEGNLKKVAESLKTRIKQLEAKK